MQGSRGAEKNAARLTRTREERAYLVRRIVSRTLAYTPLIIASLAALGPFFYVLSLSLRPGASLVTYPPDWIPIPPYFGNFRRLLLEYPFVRWFLNTLFVATVVTGVKLVIDSMAGYAFAKMEFPGKDILFMLVIMTLMIPVTATLLPSYLIVKRLGLTETYWGIMAPGLAAPIGIFLMRQFIESLPKDLENAARLDGCSEFYIYWRIVMPLIKPALAVLAIWTFHSQWIMFLWPLVVTTKPSLMLLTTGLAALKGQWTVSWPLIGAGSLLTILPLVLVFVFLQRHFIAASLAGALKQ
jgi:ABC-type glycerol-3-phosphate transport system permease component